MATNLREDFLKSVKEDSPAAFLRLIEQHVSTILSGIRMMLFGECAACSLLIDIICRLHVIVHRSVSFCSPHGFSK